MKQLSICIIAVLLISINPAFAQSSFKTITYKNALRPALTLPLIYKTDITEQTILAKLKETGYKPQKKGNIFNKKNKQEGFYVFPGVQLPELANQKLDLYFKVDELNGDSSYNSAISLLVSKGYDNFVSQDVDSATFAASEKFLNSFVSKTEAFDLGKKMEEQKASIAASEKKWQELRNKQSEARKTIAQLEADIKNWQQEEQMQQQDVDSKRSVLKDMEAKRSTIQP